MTANREYCRRSNSVFPNFTSTAASLRCKTGTRKFPLPQAGSKKRESMRSVSPLTKSSIFSTSHGGVNTSPWSATRLLDLIRFIGDGPTSGTLYRHTHDKIAHRGGGNPQLMLSMISLIDLDVRTETPTLAATLARSRLLRSLKVANG